MDSFDIIIFTCGGIFIIAGLLLQRYPPKKINNWYGYRTRMSRSSQGHWDFAQTYSARLLLLSGLYMVAAGFLNRFIHIPESQESVIAIILIIALSTLPIILTEKALKRLDI